METNESTKKETKSKTCTRCGNTYTQKVNKKYCSLKCKNNNISYHLNNVDKTSIVHPQYGACWISPLSTDISHYAKITANKKRMYLHRIAYIKAFNPSPLDMENKIVMHKCDHPACIRPSHLLLGTYKQNSLDAKSKGRLIQKLTETQVSEIRQIKGKTHKQIAEMYKVSRPMITLILNNIRHIEE